MNRMKHSGIRYAVFVVTFLTVTLFAFRIAEISPQQSNTIVFAEEIDYTFEEVPAESVILSAIGITEIQPRQSFDLSFTFNPWYTTTTKVFYDVFPESAATVSNSGKVTVSENAVVGSKFTIIATANDSESAESNTLEFEIVKIPVTGLTLGTDGTDDKLLIGKTRAVIPNIAPNYATFKSVRYELSGSGLGYIQSFDEDTGVLTARSDIISLDANATVTVTAYAVDNESYSDSVTFTLFMPSTIVELSASAPLGIKTTDDKPLAVSGSAYSDTVTLSTLVNGMPTTGLNYVIISGQNYVKNGSVRTDGTFELKSGIAEPHAEVKIKVAYSDGYDEIIISIYVPVESWQFKNIVPDAVENFREYNLEIEAFPSYATYLCDNAVPISYMLNGLSASVAVVNANGLITLPKSLTSWGTVINYTAYLPNAWVGVDLAQFNHNMNIIPVYATGFESAVIQKGGIMIDPEMNRVVPTDILNVAVSYDKDNVTHLAFSLTESSSMLSANGSNITIASLGAMANDNPNIAITITYNEGGNNFSIVRTVVIYVPAESAALDDNDLQRDGTLDLKIGLIINGHSFASDKTIEWDANPSVITVNGQIDIFATCYNGVLNVSSTAHGGTIVTARYKTIDGDWQTKNYTVAPLAGQFTLSYGESNNTNDSRQYNIKVEAPQLEEGQGVDLFLKFNGVGAVYYFGLSYTVTEISDNATLGIGSQIKEYDAFRLSAKQGQTGRNNDISYLIIINDGTETYCIRTTDKSKPTNTTLECVTNTVAIFNRISGTISVSNTTVQIDTILMLSGWNILATFNKEDLTWNLIGGYVNEENKIISAPDSGFVLTISATQKYNGIDIPFSAEIEFSSIIYNDGTSIIYRIYKKQGSSVTIASAGLCSKNGYAQARWSDSLNTYEFGAVYSGTNDLTLYPYWISTYETLSWAEELQFDENQNADQHSSTHNVIFDLAELKNLGYTTITINMSLMLQCTLHSGNYADLWLDLNGSKAWTHYDFEPNSTKSWHNYSVTLSIDAFTATSTIRFGFYTDDDGYLGKFTWKFYETSISFTANKP